MHNPDINGSKHFTGLPVDLGGLALLGLAPFRWTHTVHRTTHPRLLPLPPPSITISSYRVSNRKLKIWKDPETKTQKVDVALSIPRNVWLPHDVYPAEVFPSSSSYLGNGDGIGGKGSGWWKGRSGNSGSGSGKGAKTVFSSRKRKGFVFAPAFSVAASVVYQVCVLCLYVCVKGAWCVKSWHSPNLFLMAGS